MISVTDGPRVKLNFTEFAIEETGCQAASMGKCTCDYVKIYDGENNATLAELCDHKEIPKPIISNSKKMLIEFRSTSSTTFKGFNAKYMSTSEQPSVTPGGGSSSTTAGQ